MSRRWQTWIFFIRIQWPLILGVFLVLGAFWIAFQFIEPAPPRHVTLAAGQRGGGYDYFARRYAAELAREGITVEILETKGSLENMQLLNREDSGVEVAFAQGGTGWMAGVYQEDPAEAEIRTLAEIYREPLWILTRKGRDFKALRDLKGKTLAVGLEGSGANALSVDLLKWSGVHAANSRFVLLGEKESLQALEEGKVEAAFFVGGAGSPFLRDAVSRAHLSLHSFEDAAAYARRFGYLSQVLLPRSVLNFESDIPGRDIHLVAPSAMLLAKKDLHPALAYLFLKAAVKINGGHSILADKGEFPSANRIEFPLNEEAARYFQSGPPLLQRFLPYSVASFIDRSKILLLPFLTLLIPLLKIAYPTYQWSVRRNIWKWYKMVNRIEADYAAGQGGHDGLLVRLDEVEAKVSTVKVPFAYASELYTLRQHLVMVRKRIDRGEGRESHGDEGR